MPRASRDGKEQEAWSPSRPQPPRLQREQLHIVYRYRGSKNFCGSSVQALRTSDASEHGSEFRRDKKGAGRMHTSAHCESRHQGQRGSLGLIVTVSQQSACVRK